MGSCLKQKKIFEEEMEKLKKTICFPLGLPHRISPFGEWHSLPLCSQTETLDFFPVSPVTSHPLSQEILSHLQTKLTQIMFIVLIFPSLLTLIQRPRLQIPVIAFSVLSWIYPWCLKIHSPIMERMFKMLPMH